VTVSFDFGIKTSLPVTNVMKNISANFKIFMTLHFVVRNLYETNRRTFEMDRHTDRLQRLMHHRRDIKTAECCITVFVKPAELVMLRW